jgi:hypothetical protein
MDDLWITNNLFYSNERSVVLNSGVNRVLATGNRAENPERGFVHTYSSSTATWDLLQFTDNRIINPSTSSIGGHSVFKLIGDGNISNMIISNNIVDGGSQADHFVGRGSSITIEDSTIANNEVSGLVNARYGNLVGSGQATRVNLDGVGYNSGDPSVGGDWNGNGREGIIVRDDINGNTYIYNNGTWTQIAST